MMCKLAVLLFDALYFAILTLKSSLLESSAIIFFQTFYDTYQYVDCTSRLLPASFC